MLNNNFYSEFYTLSYTYSTMYQFDFETCHAKIIISY